MGRRRRRKEADLLDLIPPIGGLLALGLYFSPAFRQMLGGLFFLLLCFIGLVVVGLVIRAIWRHSVKKDPEPVIPSVKVVTPYVEPITWSGELLSKLEWKRFEDVVAAYSGALGYEAKTTRIGADGGVDVQLFQNGQPDPFMIIQCKAWDAYKVGVKPVRELFGVMAADKVTNGAFFTTGEFTTEAHEWAKGKPLDLVDGREFLNRIGQLEPKLRDALLETATTGDYTTPTCPNCGVKMVSRTAGKGSNAGSTFWGCRNYPRCRQTFKKSQSC
ncbi:MAG: restriction endonuclease [Lacunisphaera sp.]